MKFKLGNLHRFRLLLLEPLRYHKEEKDPELKEHILKLVDEELGLNLEQFQDCKKDSSKIQGFDQFSLVYTSILKKVSEKWTLQVFTFEVTNQVLLKLFLFPSSSL